MTKKVRRLAEQFLPEHYELEMVPDREAMTFRGRVTIAGQKKGRPSQRLTFHQNGLKILSATIVRHDKKGDQELSVDRINNHSAFDEVRLHSKEMIYPGKYLVTMEFSGTITRPMNGIYPCFFKEGTVEKQLIATQFESHHAREAFPCIDEPEAKATFDLSLVTPEGETVIANTPIKKQQRVKRQELGDKSGSASLISHDSYLMTQFETTPKMSTYLLAFVYGELKHLEAKTKGGVVVRTYATPDNIAYTKFALQIAVKVLEFYNDYFGIDYPLPKCDLIALPDFAAGAMENWGCITFREQALFVDPKNTSIAMKQYVAMVVAHELAHQWFGNLVTMRWWTDLWLNEGFASWIEYLAVDYLFPDWHMWTQFAVDEQEQGFRLDALEHTHPVEVAINHPDEIRTIFDTISYSKGSSMIHMLHQYLGADDFRDGLRHYLKTHAYGNTDTVDLWAALESVSKKPVKDFMHAWTSQPGYPIVEATFDTKELVVKQQRFYLNPKATKQSEVWPVPLKGQHELEDVVLKNSKKEISVSHDNYMLNIGRGGFYRTIYDTKHLEKLGLLIKNGTMPEVDRLGLLSDASEAAKAGYSSTIDILKLPGNYANEDSSVVWDIIAGIIGSIRGVMDDDALREDIKPYVRKLVAAQLKRLGWQAKKGESYFDGLLRPTILGMASGADEPAVLAEALKRFKAAKRSEDIEPDLRGVIYGTAARKGGKAEFDKLFALYTSSTNSEERVTLAAALTGFKQPELITKALSLIDTDAVRLQDATYWAAYSFANRHAKQQTWEWFTQHWDWLEKNLGSDLSFYRFPIYAARVFSDPKFLPVFKKFFDAHMSPALDRPVKQAIEIMEWQSAWRTRDLKALQAYFKP